jgi:hypothetical protein
MHPQNLIKNFDCCWTGKNGHLGCKKKMNDFFLRCVSEGMSISFLEGPFL